LDNRGICLLYPQERCSFSCSRVETLLSGNEYARIQVEHPVWSRYGRRFAVIEDDPWRPRWSSIKSKSFIDTLRMHQRLRLTRRIPLQGLHSRGRDASGVASLLRARCDDDAKPRRLERFQIELPDSPIARDVIWDEHKGTGAAPDAARSSKFEAEARHDNGPIRSGGHRTSRFAAGEDYD